MVKTIGIIDVEISGIRMVDPLIDTPSRIVEIGVGLVCCPVVEQVDGGTVGGYAIDDVLLIGRRA